jgi:hypothetical protein
MATGDTVVTDSSPKAENDAAITAEIERLGIPRNSHQAYLIRHGIGDQWDKDLCEEYHCTRHGKEHEMPYAYKNAPAVAAYPKPPRTHWPAAKAKAGAQASTATGAKAEPRDGGAGGQTAHVEHVADDESTSVTANDTGSVKEY